MPSCNNDVDPRDAGVVLIPTIILTFVVSIVVVAVLGYVGTGLRTSKVTTQRTNDANVAAAAMYWAIEVLATESGDTRFCDEIVEIVAPAEAMPHREPVTIDCAPPFDTGGAGVRRALLSVSLDSGPAGHVTALVDYRPSDTVSVTGSRPVRIYSWDAGVTPSAGG